jgi:hypothetical protein
VYLHHDTQVCHTGLVRARRISVSFMEKLVLMAEKKMTGLEFFGFPIGIQP